MTRHLSAFLAALLCCIGLHAASPVVTTVVVAQDGSGDFTSIQAAVNSLRSFKPEGRSCVFIKKGVYEEKVLIHSHKAEISLIGEDRDSTIILWHDHANLPDDIGGTIGTFLTYTLRIDAPDFVCENLTVVNDAMTHNNPGWFSDHKDNAKVGQAVALHVEGDRAQFRNCRFLGFQDTVYTGNPDGREYFEDCYIEGTTDFIFGPSIAYFENCTIHSKKNSYVTAASTLPGQKYGYVFKDCTLTADPGIDKCYLGRPWGAYAKTVFIGCRLGSHILPDGWHDWEKEGKPNTKKNSFYAEYGNSGPGARGPRVKWAHTLKARDLADYTFEKVMYQAQDGILWNPYDNR